MSPIASSDVRLTRPSTLSWYMWVIRQTCSTRWYHVLCNCRKCESRPSQEVIDLKVAFNLTPRTAEYACIRPDFLRKTPFHCHEGKLGLIVVIITLRRKVCFLIISSSIWEQATVICYQLMLNTCCRHTELKTIASHKVVFLYTFWTIGHRRLKLCCDMTWDEYTMNLREIYLRDSKPVGAPTYRSCVTGKVS